MVPNPDGNPKATMEELVGVLREKMQALVVCISHSWGGLEQVAASDALEVAAKGIRVRVLCMRDSPIHHNLSKHPELQLILLDYRPRDYFDLKLRKDLNRYFQDGVNLIHTHQTSLLGTITPWVWNHPEIPVFASRHIMNNHNKKNFFHGTIYSRVDNLIVMSQTLRQNVIDTHPLRERQVKVVNLGLDFDRFNPAKVDAGKQRAAWGADAETVVIGLVGRIDPAKGQEIFIKAAAGLTTRISSDGGAGRKLKFVIVGEETLGSESTHLAELKDMVRQFHLEDSVVFAGFQRNIPEVMRAFDIFVMPSRQEAFGLVAIEAMAMESPIVISSGGSASEIVGNEEFGLLMRSEDAFDLQRQLRYMIDNPDARKQMGVRAREHVMANYDKKVRLHKHLNLYERGLRKRSHL